MVLESQCEQRTFQSEWNHDKCYLLRGCEKLFLNRHCNGVCLFKLEYGAIVF